MATKGPLVQGYAQAIFAVAEAEGHLADVEDELFRFAKAVEADTKLRDGLTDIAVPVENKKALLADLLGQKANPHTVSLLNFIVEQGRARELGQIVDALIALAAERRKHAVAEIRSAVPLSEDQRAKLQSALSKATGKDIEIRAVVDPTVVGGIVARVGDQVIDGSVAGKLAALRDHLKAQ